MNRAKVLFILIAFAWNSIVFSQVVISNERKNPEPSAMLEINSIDKGFLLPRMTLLERGEISSPAEGLMIYCFDCGRNGTPVISVYMSGSWKNLTGCMPPSNPNSGLHIPNSSKITWKWSKIPGAAGYRWSHLPDALELDLTDTSYIETGLICGTAYMRYVWAYNDCGLSQRITINASTNYQPPPAPAAASHVPELTQITWKWLHLDDATGYKWNTVQSYENAISVTDDTAYTESGLKCDSLYYRYLWAYNNCGVSDVTVLNQAAKFDTLPVPVEGSHIPTPSQIAWNWNNVPGALGYKWNTTNNYSSAINLGTQLTFLETGLDCQTEYTRYLWAYNNCGYSPVRILSDTTLDIPISEAPDEASHYSTAISILWKWYDLNEAYSYKWGLDNNYNTSIDLGPDTAYIETDLACNTSYLRYVWAYDSCGSSPAGVLSFSTRFDSLPGPAAGTHVAAADQITWHWNEVTGATGYKWSITNDFANAMILGNELSYLETGLTCGVNYTRYVWAVNDCGHSIQATTLTKSTNNCWICGDPLSINHQAGAVAPINKAITYGTVSNIPGLTSKCWITSNLGASHQASSVDDATEPSAGWYWQFNHTQGFSHDGTNRLPNSVWINPITSNSNWELANDPCAIELGSGWRLPSNSEWNAVDVSGSWTNWDGPWGSALKMHAAGRLAYTDGTLGFRGSQGAYWSSTQNTNYSYGQSLFFFSSSCSTMQYYKAHGYSIRCLKD